MAIFNPIICAIDTPDVEAARALAMAVKPSVGAIKLGLEFFTSHGPLGVRAVAVNSGLPLFLDLKFHDIPNTVAGAVRATAGINAFMMTVHAGGGLNMMKAAADASMELAATTGKDRPLIVGVTVLTSMDGGDLNGIGIESPVDAQVLRLAELAKKAGLDGVVCSAHEISAIRAACGPEFKLVVPGIRPEGAEVGDQKRVLAPKAALEKGADFLVIGRPITASANPAEAAKNILETLK